MFSDSYTQIEHGTAAEILDQLNPLLDGAPFDPAMARILSHDLPFYNGYSVVEVTDHDVNPPRQVSFVYKNSVGGDRVFILNGQNEIIYFLNKHVPIFLNEENIKLYIRFFFSYVRGRHGRFIIVENVDEVDWREEPAPAGRKALSKMIVPINLKNIGADGVYHLSASIVFKDSLFESDINVDENGTVSLSNQELLVEDIPVIDDQFDQ